MQQKRKFTNQQFLELFNKGLYDRQIAEKLKVSNAFIQITRYKLGLMPKTPYRNSNPRLSYEKLKENNKRYNKIQNQKPERKEAKRAYSKAYNMRPEVKAKRKARDQAISQTPEFKAKRKVQSKIREQKPERKVWKKAYNKAYNMRPEVKAKRKAHNQAMIASLLANRAKREKGDKEHEQI